MVSECHSTLCLSSRVECKDSSLLVHSIVTMDLIEGPYLSFHGSGSWKHLKRGMSTAILSLASSFNTLVLKDAFLVIIDGIQVLLSQQRLRVVVTILGLATSAHMYQWALGRGPLCQMIGWQLKCPKVIDICGDGVPWERAYLVCGLIVILARSPDL